MDGTHFIEGRRWVSPFNSLPEVVAARAAPRKVLVHDATLRDGEQTPGVVFRKADKVAIAKALDLVGVDRIEAGMPAVSKEDFDAIAEISALNLKAEVFAFARAMREDVDQALECGASGVVVEVPIGRPKLERQFGWTWEDVLRKSAPVIEYARAKGLYVVFFPYDATRADIGDLEALFRGIMAGAPPDSIGIVDTMGCATPEAIAWLTRFYKSATGLPVEIHSHNDFGMAVASELAAVGAGAEVVHCCVNGLGERTGNAALEELVIAMEYLYAEDSGRNLGALKGLSELVASLSGVPIARNKPVVGSGNFTRESGIGANLVVDDPLAMFAVHPSVLGDKGRVVLGKKSGAPSVEYKLRELGLGALDEGQAKAALAEVKRLGNDKRGLVDDGEFIEIVNEARRKAR